MLLKGPQLYAMVPEEARYCRAGAAEVMATGEDECRHEEVDPENVGIRGC